MNRIQIFCKVNNGKISTTSSDEIKQFIQANEGKNLEITLQRRKAKHSDQQRKYYFGCVVPIVCEALKELGHRLTKEECHEWLKMKFNYESVANEHGDLIGDIPKSITLMGKTEMVEYIDKIAQWCSEFLNITIPEPNSQSQLQY